MSVCYDASALRPVTSRLTRAARLLRLLPCPIFCPTPPPAACSCIATRSPPPPPAPLPPRRPETVAGAGSQPVGTLDPRCLNPAGPSASPVATPLCPRRGTAAQELEKLVSRRV